MGHVAYSLPCAGNPLPQALTPAGGLSGASWPGSDVGCSAGASGGRTIAISGAAAVLLSQSAAGVSWGGSHRSWGGCLSCRAFNPPAQLDPTFFWRPAWRAAGAYEFVQLFTCDQPLPANLVAKSITLAMAANGVLTDTQFTCHICYSQQLHARHCTQNCLLKTRLLTNYFSVILCALGTSQLGKRRGLRLDETKAGKACAAGVKNEERPLTRTETGRRVRRPTDRRSLSHDREGRSA